MHRCSPNSYTRVEYQNSALALDHCQPNQKSTGQHLLCTLFIGFVKVWLQLAGHDVLTEVLTKIINTMICTHIRPGRISKPAREFTNMNGVCRLFDTVVIVIEHLSEEFLLMVSQRNCVPLPLFTTTHEAV